MSVLILILLSIGCLGFGGMIGYIIAFQKYIKCFEELKTLQINTNYQPEPSIEDTLRGCEVYNNYEDYVNAGKNLYKEGYTEILPADIPRILHVGYVFTNNKDETKYLVISIPKMKRTCPKEINEKFFKTSNGRVDFVENFKSE